MVDGKIILRSTSLSIQLLTDFYTVKYSIVRYQPRRKSYTVSWGFPSFEAPTATTMLTPRLES
jgi:hypothetical protein